MDAALNEVRDLRELWRPLMFRDRTADVLIQ